MAKIHVWYHAQCDDGFGAAWAAYKFFESVHRIKDVVFTPVKYNTPAPIYNKEDVIYIVDFSFPRPELEYIADNCKALYILDHHKTAMEALKDFPNALFDMNRSGAIITWNYFFTQKPPLLLRYVQANDLWRHSTMPNCKEVIRYIRSFPHSFDKWTELNTKFETDLEGIIEQAIAVERYFQNQITFNISNSKVIQFMGHRCPVINCNPTFTSEMCHELLVMYSTPIAMSYFIDSTNHAIISLRGADDTDIDVGKIAKAFDGGGHPKAAGFKMPAREFIKQMLEPPYHNTQGVSHE